ncbi:SH3 domain-containing protein [Aquibium sp. ELW1220]|uniref:SH3 domain-containing protein n=1 Tax=Aquibium sp. ELW1220 TaxID=2976766 RepID=UPI0025B26230|nr:SH3 domain-containing protein [Aquibium sp. ELW1220]MDN2583001.1 SH3 domain-containing protein [Aquibium sp. ELW1220]
MLDNFILATHYVGVVNQGAEMKFTSGCVLLLLLLCAGTASAATLKSSALPGCDYELVGDITTADAEKVERIDTEVDGGVTLCLNSPGGSVTGGLKLFELLPRKNITTRIPPDWVCESACAVAFMAGRIETGLGMGIAHAYAGHSMEPGGTLGFHAPGLNLPTDRQYSGEEVDAAFRIALTAAQRYFRASLTEEGEWRAFNEYLLARILETPADSMYRIETVADAVLGGINLSQVRLPARVGDAEIANLCDAAFIVRGPLVYRVPKSTAIESYRRVRNEGEFSDEDRAFFRTVSTQSQNGRIVGRVGGYDVRSATRATGCEVTFDLVHLEESYVFSHWLANGAEIKLITYDRWDDSHPQDWWRLPEIEVNTFWVPLWYLYAPETPLVALSPGGTGEPAAPSAGFEATHVVESLDTGFLNLRQGPGNDEPVIARMDHGVAVAVGELNARGWAKVTLQDGRRGWAYARYLVASD